MSVMSPANNRRHVRMLDIIGLRYEAIEFHKFSVGKTDICNTINQRKLVTFFQLKLDGNWAS